MFTHSVIHDILLRTNTHSYSMPSSSTLQEIETDGSDVGSGVGNDVGSNEAGNTTYVTALSRTFVMTLDLFHETLITVHPQHYL